jgi:hypothetical protein
MQTKEKKILIIGLVVIVFLFIGNMVAFYFLYQELNRVEVKVSDIEMDDVTTKPPQVVSDDDISPGSDNDTTPDDNPETPPEENPPVEDDRYKVMNWTWSFDLGGREIEEIPVPGWAPEDHQPVEPYTYRVKGTPVEQQRCPTEEIGVSMARYYGRKSTEEENYVNILNHGAEIPFELYNVTTTMKTADGVQVYTIPAQNLGDASELYVFRNGDSKDYYYHIWIYGTGEFWDEDPTCSGERYLVEKEIAADIIRSIKFE